MLAIAVRYATPVVLFNGDDGTLSVYNRAGKGRGFVIKFQGRHYTFLKCDVTADIVAAADKGEVANLRGGDPYASPR